ncbi:hypothetical protein NIES4072_51450 [Nostoc commune NIES-4072]|uniref:Uncharacterized protein n=1 Tax=Nostoc commune NIES-4072 TaxID=2005467 RepID=A0A2R5G044_NOSCO|nr:hypothetical protein NIES4070_39500 [Nostoc commune HK-02]GBG21461.1 hypothetical protein NIES4072_51450 [Nostoc commune NIES-4072]
MPKPLLNPVSDGKQRRTDIFKKQSTVVQYGVNKHTISNGARSSEYNYA